MVFIATNRKEMLRITSFKKRELQHIDDTLGHQLDNVLFRESISMKKKRPGTLNLKLQAAPPLKNLTATSKNPEAGTIASPEPANVSSPSAEGELTAAAIKLQKFYKSYRTRRNLADCAVVVEELWWKALEFAALKRSSVLFFRVDRSETAASRWARARTLAAKLGKGLLKDEKAQKLALRHWLEAIDPRHRYGHNLHFYYDIWFASESSQPFFYWLDVGDGKELNLEKCPRTKLQHECIAYLGSKERKAYEVIVKEGKLVYRQSRDYVDTREGSKWIFVLSTSRNLYIGEKKKGHFQHSSFLAGAATIASGRLVVNNGVLKAIWAYSGHYRPTEENFIEFCRFLEEQSLDLTNVKKCPVDDDIHPRATNDDMKPRSPISTKPNPNVEPALDPCEDTKQTTMAKGTISEMEVALPCKKWTTGAGPRISCVRDYPARLQFQALEKLHLSPRVKPGVPSYGPIPSPRPSPKIRLSPRLAYMGLVSPRVHISSVN